MRTKMMKMGNMMAWATMLVISGCGSNENDKLSPDDLTLKVEQTQQSECKGQTKADSTDTTGNSSESVKATVDGDAILITHQDARYNCAAKVKMDVSLTGTELLVQETITNPNETAKCECNFDLSVKVSGLANGTYTVKVLKADKTVAGSAQAIIGASTPQPEVGPTQQSKCKNESKADSDSAPLEKITTEIQGTSSVLITHQDAPYNCASTLRADGTVSGKEIVVHEVITNPTVLADCTCKFDLSVAIKNLSSGSYTLKVINAYEKLVGTTEVVIP